MSDVPMMIDDPDPLVVCMFDSNWKLIVKVICMSKCLKSIVCKFEED